MIQQIIPARADMVLPYAPPAPRRRIITPGVPRIVPATRIPKNIRSIWERWVEQERWQLAVATPTNVVSSAGSGTGYSTTAFTPIVGQLYLAAMANRSPSATVTDPSDPSGHSGFSGVWAAIGSEPYSTSASPTRRVKAWWNVCDVAGQNDTLDFTFSGVSQTAILGRMQTIASGFHPTVPILNFDVNRANATDNAPNVTLTPSVTAGNVVIAYFSRNIDTAQFTADAPYSSIGATLGSGGSSLSLDTIFASSPDDTPSGAYSAGSSAWGGIAFEVQVAPAVAGILAKMMTYEG